VFLRQVFNSRFLYKRVWRFAAIVVGCILGYYLLDHVC
jgi:hypothetical protein